MARRLIALVLIAVLAVVAIGYYRQRARADTAEHDAGLAASRVLSAVFERSERLQVAALSGEVLTRTEAASGVGGMFADTQTTRAPYRVLYTIDLGAVSAADYQWDARDQVMIVTLPDVSAGPPNIDMTRARVEQTGLFISRTAGRQMQARAAANLATAVADKAASPDHLAAARAAARAAVARLVRQPLQAAGLGPVTVRIRFAFEGRRDDRPWDVSRSVKDVLRSKD